MYELHFNERAELLEGSALPIPGKSNDILVLTHGWNNNADDARELYHSIESQLVRFGAAPPIVGVFWPSKKFDDDLGKQFDDALDHPIARQVPVGAVRAAVHHGDIANDLFHSLPVDVLLRRLAGPATLRHGLLNLMNLTTFYQMKQRSGVIGENGLAPQLDLFAAKYPQVRIHLAGHSFGARLVSAAANTVCSPVQSLTLLQGAFSHHGFAPSVNGKPGAFRDVVAKSRVNGTISATHTRNDKAVGLAYALAARVAGQEAAFLGDGNDRFGGIGSNGAQRTPEAVQQSLLPATRPYNFQKGKIHNMKADTFIGSHTDIVNPEVAWLLRQAIAA